jgi:hypothetical protein
MIATHALSVVSILPAGRHLHQRLGCRVPRAIVRAPLDVRAVVGELAGSTVANQVRRGK